MRAKVGKWLRAPRGCDVRRLVAWMTLAVALPRLPLFGLSVSTTVYPLGILPPETFGWVFLTVALCLLATDGKWRLSLWGRLAALLALLAWSVLTAASTSITSILLDLAIMYALLGEIIAGQGDPC